MKYLSFSLWGDKPIYNVGTIRNAELWKNIYPDWQMVVYYDNTVPTQTIEKLKELDVRLINMSSEIYPPFWRFLIADEIDSEYSIFRDSDSRISIREKVAVDEWINSGKKIHVMRDHPFHKIPAGNFELGILAGMWGIKGNGHNFLEEIKDFCKNNSNRYGVDQSFLRKIYDKFKNDKLCHDDFFDGIPFTIKRESFRFIGERIDIDDKPLNDDYKHLK